MRKSKLVPMTNRQLAHLSFRTHQWCRGILLQGKRFLDEFDNDHSGDYWGESSGSFYMDRLFLITALHHAIVCLERFNWELEQRNDFSFKAVLDAISTPDERKKIVQLRNMNEHDLEYLTGCGNAQKDFTSTVEKNQYHLQINAFGTILHGIAEVFVLGDVEIDKLLFRFKDNLPAVKLKTEEVFVLASAMD